MTDDPTRADNARRCMQTPVQPNQRAAQRHRRRFLFVSALVLAALAWPAYHLAWRQHVRRFQVVREGVLYRVAQPSQLGVDYMVRSCGVKTILNLRTEDDHLREGMLALRGSDGPLESEYTETLGARSLQWPMGPEAYWPWATPWHFEEFFHLMDDPENLPVAVHCVSGRHRTGTMSALFRLEYDRWPIERVLAEMYSFRFGPPIPLQEMNLRTYVPRPLPTAHEWAELRERWIDLCPAAPPAEYRTLVAALRRNPDRGQVHARLVEQLESGGVFALPLAVRLLDDPDAPAGAAAATVASACLERDNASATDYASAAALVADFGNEAQQQQLLDCLRAEIAKLQTTPKYRAVVSGIASRYTKNRVPFLTPLLGDERLLSDDETVPLRYCDLAVVRLAAIADERFLHSAPMPTREEWNAARQAATAWIQGHPPILVLSRLQLPPSKNVVR